MKYPSLEIVVGLELDQKIVRSSFKYFRTQPHWDNEKVQWWYGDAAKSFLMLPQEYYGTFDLVLVDLESDVIDMVKVTDDLSIMDAALLLLSPEGVIVRNVDFGFESNHRFTDYELDLSNVDVPMFCYQGVTVGSNSIDFLTQNPKDHNIETLYLKPVNEIENQYDMWYNYQKNTTNTLRLDSCCKDLLSNAKSGGAGVMMILEAEDATTSLASLSSPEDTSISQALIKAGLTQIRVKKSSMKGGRAMLIFILKEGYVVARTWPKLRYCAFDIQLWTHFEELDKVRNELIVAVGGKVSGKSSSSYRIVTSGMYGVSPEAEDSSNAACPCATEINENEVPAVDHSIQEASVKGASDTVIAESISLTQNKNTAVVVMCGQQEVQSCSALQALKIKDVKDQKILPIWTCPDVASEEMSACETNTLQRLKELVKKNNKIGGIVITPEVPRAMGQVLHKILNSKRHQRELLVGRYVVLVEMPLLDESESSWRKALLDRFRTDLAMYDPSYHAEILFNKTSSGSSLGLGVFSTNDDLFFLHLADMIEAIESKTGYVAEVPTIRNGKNTYVADFTPTMVFSPDDYDHSPADEQWNAQKPLGRQTIVQLKRKETDIKLSAKKFKMGLKKALQKTLKSFEDFDMDSADVKGFNVGEGCVIGAFWSTGNAIVSWNGRARVDLNIFTFDEDEDIHYEFEDEFLSEAPQRAEVMSRDEQPRGIGRVVYFKEEISTYDNNEKLDEEFDDEDAKTFGGSDDAVSTEDVKSEL